MKKQMIYSTMYLTDGAAGSQALFTIPIGQTMAAMFGSEARCPTCGRHDRAPTLTVEHTNIAQAGQFGSAIGDVWLTSVEIKTSDGKVQRSAIGLGSWELRVSGHRVAGGRIAELLDGAVPLPRVPVTRTDTFEVSLGVAEGTMLKRPDKEPLFVKVEFWADVAEDVDVSA